MDDLVKKLAAIAHRLEHDYNEADVRTARKELLEAIAALKRPDEGAYRKFFLDVAAHCFDDGTDLDYETFLDLGTEHGLLKKVMYDPEKHGSNEWGVEPGADWFEIVGATHPAPVAVDDAMVRAACRVWYGNDLVSDKDMADGRKALEAALGAGAQGGV